MTRDDVVVPGSGEQGPLVPVFSTTDRALVPLAEIALEQEGIEHWLRGVPTGRNAPHSVLESAPANDPVDILVNVADADRARALLADLQSGRTAAVPPAFAEPDHPAAHDGATDVDIRNAETGGLLGRISESELTFISDRLEEDEAEPQTYYIDAPTIEFLQSAGCPPAVLELLERALANRASITIRWSSPDRGEFQ